MIQADTQIFGCLALLHDPVQSKTSLLPVMLPCYRQAVCYAEVFDICQNPLSV